jgi:hypothetical protein
MNKKLFALLTSAALMAGFAPSVFAADAGKTASLEFKGPETVEAGATADFDVVINANTKLDTIQFAFVTEGAEVQDFKFDNKAVKSLGFDDKGFKGKMSEQDKIDYPDNEDYQVMAFDQDFESTYVSKVDEDGNPVETAPLVAPENIKIGTLTVKVADDATAVTVTTSDMKKGAGATGVANYEVDKFATWTTVAATATVGGATESKVEESSKEESKVEDSSKADSSQFAPSSSSESKKDDSASSSSSSSSKNDSKSSSKATNGTTSNTNTGAASTAAVALAAAAAAMVVISKKRK